MGRTKCTAKNTKDDPPTEDSTMKTSESEYGDNINDPSDDDVDPQTPRLRLSMTLMPPTTIPPTAAMLQIISLSQQMIADIVVQLASQKKRISHDV
jgi:hypothetical protein